MNTREKTHENSLINTLNDSLIEYRKYIYNNYLNNEDIPLFMREFYSESSSWFLNQDIEDMKYSIEWSSLDDNDKLEILNDDLDEYFNN